MTFLQAEAALRLRVPGFRKSLRLSPLRRVGALETFTVDGEALEAVRFFPAGAVREAGGRLTPMPEAAAFYAAAVDDFEALGRRLKAATPRAAPRVEAVARAAGSCFWLQSPGGLTLEAWLADHPDPVAEPVVAAFARRLGEAIGELHAAGVVHGDLSPRAVLIDGDDVHLTGFMIDRRPFFRVLRSQQGLVEPGYAPPEAHDGAARHPIGAAADLYAASALLQRLLTGRAPVAANLAARVAGDNPWPSDVAVSAALRRGIDAGLAPAAEARPASAAGWMAGLELGPEPDGAPWFDGMAMTLPAAPPPEPAAGSISPPDEPAFFEIPLMVGTEAEAPLTLAQGASARRRFGWWAVPVGLAVGAVAVAAVALVAPQLASRSKGSRGGDAPGAASRASAAPAAPAGCQWLPASDGWRLRCGDAPVQGPRLPDRFDSQTTARAEAGDPTAMERLGAFYRLRAGETANPDRGAYAYQALGWLDRAAAAADDGRPDTARARDDADLALGQMLARGEGGRAPNPAAAEARLRKAAAGSRADAVLALGQLLEAQAGGDAHQLTEARGLYARVAQLGDASVLQREGERGLARIDGAAKPPPVEIVTRTETPLETGAVETPGSSRNAIASNAKPYPAKVRVETRENKPVIVRAEPRARAAPGTQKSSQPAKARVDASAKPSPALDRPAKRAAPVSPTPPRPAATAPRPLAAAPPALRTWTASAFVKVDPTLNFYPALEVAGRAACASDGGETLSVRTGDTLCPNGVNYCQVRAVATCQGARP